MIAKKIFYCSMKASDVPKLEVKLGDHNIQSTTDTKTTDVKVANIIKHKGFSQRTLVSKSIQVGVLDNDLLKNHFFEISNLVRR